MPTTVNLTNDDGALVPIKLKFEITSSSVSFLPADLG